MPASYTTGGTNATIWQVWSSTSATSTSSSWTNGTADPWSIWVTGSTTSSATTDTWYLWNAATQQAVRHSRAVQQEFRRVVQQETPELRAAREAERERQRVVAAAEAAAIQAARDKAEKLLVEHLNAEQRECLRANGYFFVDVAGKRYRIDRGRSRNVRLLGADGRIARTYCAHPSDLCPDADTMLAQKLMLECDEPAFLARANVS